MVQTMKQNVAALMTLKEMNVAIFTIVRESTVKAASRKIQLSQNQTQICIFAKMSHLQFTVQQLTAKILVSE
jgi:hypothetical protein